MRVLHVHSGNLFGGIETLLLTLVRHRGRVADLEQRFALCSSGRLSDELAASGCVPAFLGPVRFSRPVSLWRARQKLAGLLRSEPVDVAICHSAWSLAIFGTAIRSSRVPLVLWLHGPLRGQHWLERLARRCQPDWVIANSHCTARSIPALYPQTPSAMIYCPVSASLPAPTAAERSALRAELQTSDDAVVILQAGRMESGKGQLIHLEALAQLASEPRWICWQVGGAQRPQEAAFLEKLKAAAVALGIAHRVRFPGERSSLAKLLSAADIYCQPNIAAEGFGITFIEALYAGLPVVATQIGAPLEIVDETCGLTVPPGDSPALASALRTLVEDSNLRRSLGSRGPSRAARLCDPDTQIHQMLRVLRDVAPEKPHCELAIAQHRI